jgi:hypothetical protein
MESNMQSTSTKRAESGKAPATHTESEIKGLSVFGYASVLAMGAYLGIIFVKSEVARWQRVHDMFLFREAHMYVIIGIGVAVATVSMFLIRRFQIKDVQGKPIVYTPKPYHLGVVFGGMLFGAGWAITGACPGPIYAQIGAGEWMAVLTLLGALLGMFTYAVLRPKLPH